MKSSRTYSHGATVTSVHEVLIRAPRSLVYEIFADRERYGDIMPISSRLITAGHDTRQGVGAVHFLGQGRIGVREQITELLLHEHLAYKVVGGLPTHAHRGWVTLADRAYGTHVTYTMENIPGCVPTTVVRLLLPGVIRFLVNAVQKDAERRTAHF